mmetsp:Transcript_39042/g.44657  ORF Transcript_39042/g.44657 Transcript_39042/m.44657 type:complete len:147 (-) Transcript_39042:41-481(-)
MTNNEFYKAVNMKNRAIENYKKPRGFPLQLGENEMYLFSFDFEVTHERMIKMKREREQLEARPPVKNKNLNLSEDSFFDSCDDVESLENFENLQSIKKATLKPLHDGKNLVVLASFNFEIISIVKSEISNRYENIPRNVIMHIPAC